MVAILVVLTIVVALAIDALVMARRRRAANPRPVEVVPMPEPRPPQGLFVDSAHAWLRITTDGTLRVGLDEFLLGAVGSVEKVTPAARGSHVRRGDPLLRLTVRGRELVIPAPADGDVAMVNDRVLAEPWLLGRDPYGVGWVVGLRTRDHAEAIRGLRIGSAVTGFLRQEMQRLADFLIAGARTPAGVPLLADGAVPLGGCVADLDDEGWQAFQRDFLGANRG